MTNDSNSWVEERIEREMLFYQVIFGIPIAIKRRKGLDVRELEMRKIEVMAIQFARPISRFSTESFQTKVDFLDDVVRLNERDGSHDEFLALCEPWMYITGYQVVKTAPTLPYKGFGKKSKKISP